MTFSEHYSISTLKVSAQRSHLHGNFPLLVIIDSLFLFKRNFQHSTHIKNTYSTIACLELLEPRIIMGFSPHLLSCGILIAAKVDSAVRVFLGHKTMAQILGDCCQTPTCSCVCKVYRKYGAWRKMSQEATIFTIKYLDDLISTLYSYYPYQWLIQKIFLDSWSILLLLDTSYYIKPPFYLLCGRQSFANLITVPANRRLSLATVALQLRAVPWGFS